MAQSAILSSIRLLSDNKSAIRAIAKSFYKEYTDLIHKTFYAIWCDEPNDSDDEDSAAAAADGDGDEDELRRHRNLMSKMRVRRKMCIAAASRRTDLLVIITALQACTKINGSNLYTVHCGSAHILVNVYTDVTSTAVIASTSVFPEPGDKLDDEDLVNLAESIIKNAYFMPSSLKDAVHQRNPEVVMVSNSECSYPMFLA
jgi:hypothetical protein